MAKTLAKVFLISLVFICTFARATLIPPQYFNAVVALGSMNPIVFPGQIALPGQPCVWTTEGTGFLYGYLVQNDPDLTKRKYEVYLVTNRHVITEHTAALAIAKLKRPLSSSPPPQPEMVCGSAIPKEDIIKVRMNPLNSSLQGKEFDLPIKNWFFHQNSEIDIAAIRLNPEYLKTEGLLGVFFQNDDMVYNKGSLKEKGVAAGDGVFVLGFPMNLAGVQRNYVIVRQGCIARISDMLDGQSINYLLDAFIFPGNSGSPVILKPEIVSITGTPSQNKAVLIGIVNSYQFYRDVAISPQTNRERFAFEENSGLAEVLPTDYIDEAIADWRKANQPKQ